MGAILPVVTGGERTTDRHGVLDEDVLADHDGDPLGKRLDQDKGHGAKELAAIVQDGRGNVGSGQEVHVQGGGRLLRGEEAVAKVAGVDLVVAQEEDDGLDGVGAQELRAVDVEDVVFVPPIVAPIGDEVGDMKGAKTLLDEERTVITNGAEQNRTE